MTGANLSSPAGISQAATKGAKAILGAIAQINAESGIRAFWVGNGLSVVKIFPESAIKFYSYESAVRLLFYAQQTF